MTVRPVFFRDLLPCYLTRLDRRAVNVGWDFAVTFVRWILLLMPIRNSEVTKLVLTQSANGSFITLHLPIQYSSYSLGARFDRLLVNNKIPGQVHLLIARFRLYFG